MAECPECGSRFANFFGYCRNCGEEVQEFEEYWAETIDEFSLRPAFAFHTRPLWQSVVVFGAIVAIGWFAFVFLWEEIFRGDFRATSAAARTTRIQAAALTGSVMGVVAGIAMTRARGGWFNIIVAWLSAWLIPSLYQYQKYGVIEFLSRIYFKEELMRWPRLNRLEMLIPLLMVTFPALITGGIIWRSFELWMKRKGKFDEWCETFWPEGLEN